MQTSRLLILPRPFLTLTALAPPLVPSPLSLRLLRHEPLIRLPLLPCYHLLPKQPGP